MFYISYLPPIIAHMCLDVWKIPFHLNKHYQHLMFLYFVILFQNTINAQLKTFK